MPRYRVSVKLFVKIYFHLYERKACPPWRDLAINYPRSRPKEGWKLSILTHLRRLALKSKLRTHDKVCLGQHLFWITFHFTSSVCLSVGYKMKTCTQISDSNTDLYTNLYYNQIYNPLYTNPFANPILILMPAI